MGRGNAIAGAIGLVPLNHRTRPPSAEGDTFQHQVLMKRVVVPSYHFDPFSRSYCSRSSAQNSLRHACSIYYWAEQSWVGFAWVGGRDAHMSCSPSSNATTLEKGESRARVSGHGYACSQALHGGGVMHGAFAGTAREVKEILTLESVKRQHHDKNCANSRNISLISLQTDKSQLKERLRCYLLVICA